MEIKEVLELGAGFAKNQSDLVIRILSSRSEFVQKIDYNSDAELKRAVVYAAFLSIIGLIFAAPTLRLSRFCLLIRLLRLVFFCTRLYQPRRS